MTTGDQDYQLGQAAQADGSSWPNVCDECGGYGLAYETRLRRQRDEARARASEFHRRMQQAEAVVAKGIESQMTPDGPANVGRGLANVAAQHYKARAGEAEAKRDALADALRKIERWSDAYPLDRFPEPDFAKARRVLEDAGMTLDAISASNMRHVVTGVGRIAKEALAALEEGE